MICLWASAIIVIFLGFIRIILLLLRILLRTA